MRPGLLLALAVWLAGCGATTHTALPPAPPGAGVGVGTVGLQISGARPSLASVQLGVYVGVGSRGVVGGTFTDFSFVPAVSAALYAPSGDGWVSARGHLQNPFGVAAEPTVEAELAYTLPSGDVVVRGGVGVVTEGPLLRLIRHAIGVPQAPALPPRVVLTAGVDATPGRALASVEVHAGLGRATARNRVARQHRDLDSLGAALGGLVLGPDRVASVEPGDGGWTLATVTLTDGRTLTIRTRDPYPDCQGCAYDLAVVRASRPTNAHRTTWVDLTDARRSYVLALDVDAILATWRDRRILDLPPLPDAADRAARRAPLWRDVSVMGGIAEPFVEAEATAPAAARLTKSSSR